VFRELTSARVQQPWIEAFKQKQQQDESSVEPGPAKPQTPADHKRDLEPKKMHDSYHSVVRDFDDAPLVLIGD
jgi:acyl-coenzyme A thioesterase 9